jgi:hypothetical protein
VLHRTPLVLVASALCLASLASAQSPAHKIPVRGAALYEREFKRQTKVLEPDPATMKRRHVHEVPNRAGPAVVLHSDLHRKARRIEKLPVTLLGIATYVAYDLSTLGKKKFGLDVSQVRPFGALRLDGEIAPQAGGVECLVIKVSPGPVPKRGVKPQGVLRGELKIVRKFDPERGIIERIETVFTGEMHFPNRTNANQVHRAQFTLHDNWKLREVIGNRGNKFDGRVGAAIRKGAADLKKLIAGDVSKRYPRAPAGNGQTQSSGRLALILLTLLKAGESPFDPVMKKALDDLRKRYIADTYSLGVALLTMEACYTPSREREDLLSGRIKEARLRKPTEKDRQTIEVWVRQLLMNRPASDRDSTARWHYLPSNGFDNSCSQYAVLGLYAAHLCGVEIDRRIWIGAARHFLQVQSKSSGKVRFRLATHQQVAKDPSGRGTVSATDAAGWSYTDKYRLPTGSMTTSGIGSLTICNAVLRGKGRPKDVSLSRVQGAIKSGFAWLASHYDVRQNPGHGSGWRLYYLYGLERACELNQIAHIQSKDWYFDGATLLLEEQGKNGRWGSEIDTCFAILFLKKAALPVVTGRR